MEPEEFNELAAACEHLSNLPIGGGIALAAAALAVAWVIVTFIKH